MFCEGCFVRCLRCTSQRISNSILARLGIVLENRERWNKNTGEEKARSRKGGQFRFHSDFFQKSDEISGQRKFTGLRGVNLRKLEGGGEGRGGKGSERVAFEKLIRRSDDWCFESGASDNFNRFSILFRFQTHPESFSLDIRDKFRPPFFLHFSWPISVRITKEDDFSKTGEASKSEINAAVFRRWLRVHWPIRLEIQLWTILLSARPPRLFHGRYPALKFPRRISHRSN